MRTPTRLVLAALTLSGGLGLAGCDTIDWFADTMQGLVDTKRKLPGDRKAVFPEGVPGVTPGVPQEYMKRTPGEGASEEAAREGGTSGEPKATPERKERPARRPPPQQSAEAPKKPAAATPAPAQPIQSQDGTSSSPQTAPTQAPWPAPPPSGTFSR